MDFISDLYYRSLAKNEESLRFWETYLQNLRSLDFSEYGDKLKVPVLVPVGSRIFFRGELKHTNEVTVALGGDYFVKCSLKQAEVLRQHRIKGAESKVKEFQTEREYIQKRLSFSTENVFRDQGHEIVEEFTEKEDLEWRKKHRENMRQYKQRSKTDQPKVDISDEELWMRLEELELKEELDEIANMETAPDKQNKILFNKEDIIEPVNHKSNNTNGHVEPTYKEKDITGQDGFKLNESYTPETTEDENPIFSEKFTDPKNNSKLDLLQKVIEQQNELKEKLNEMKNKQISPSQSVKELISRLDEIEQFEELEDEIDRIDEVLQSEDETQKDELVDILKKPEGNIKRSVSFADEETSETLEIVFRHSDTEPDKTSYDKDKGITKPSDVYTAFSNLFTETTSILKKSKYERDLSPCGPRVEKRTKVDDFQEAADNRQINKTISLNDIVEKVDENDNQFEDSGKRPMSLFKKRRQQNLR